MSTPPPPGGTQPAPQRGPDRTAVWGWLGIVVGLLCCGVLGIIFGALSLREADKHGSSRTLGFVAIGAGVLNILVGGSAALTGTWPW